MIAVINEDLEPGLLAYMNIETSMSQRFKLKVLIPLGIILLIGAVLGVSYINKLRDEPIYHELGVSLSQQMLNEVLLGLEKYKDEKGEYPESLFEYRGNAVSLDPAINEGNCRQDYYYALNAATQEYVLRSTGPDGIPFTADDLFPEVPDGMKGIGLRFNKLESANYPEKDCK